MDAGRLPKPWLTCRVVGIDKEGTEEKRPITVASALYRVCLTATLRRLRRWILRWIPEEIIGGIPERDAAWAFSNFESEAGEARRAGQAFMGVKLDLSKAFDRVWSETTNVVLERLGAPPGLVRILWVYDQHHVRYIECGGCVHPTPIVTQGRSLPQGCPASPLRLAVLMSIWSICMARAPSLAATQHYVFVDDRVLWRRCDDEDGTANIDEELVYNERLERALGLVDNPKSGRRLATEHNFGSGYDANDQLWWCETVSRSLVQNYRSARRLPKTTSRSRWKRRGGARGVSRQRAAHYM